MPYGYSDFHYNKSELYSMYNITFSLHDALTRSYDAASAMFEMLKTTEAWKGRAKDEFMSFFHLVIQYHAWIVGRQMPEYDGYRTNKSASDSIFTVDIASQLISLYYKLDGFEITSDTYKKLKELG